MSDVSDSKSKKNLLDMKKSNCKDYKKGEVIGEKVAGCKNKVLLVFFSDI